MLKKAQLSYKGMNQDISNSKRDPGLYYDAKNIRILATDSNTTGSITNDKGTTLKFSIAQGYTIIGHATIKNYMVLLCTNNTDDIIYRVDLDTNIPEILFEGNLNFSTENYIETEVYYESEDVQKVYWVDGRNQLRHINVAATTIPYTADQAVLFDAVPEVSFSPIQIVSEDFGGTHTTGMIQYGYNLVSKGGSQSSLSPLTQLIPLTKQSQGGKLNEIVGKIINIKIESVDSRYNIIRVYSIKYTSYNELPQFNLIAEENISGSTFTFSDDGRVISSLTQDELLFLGGTPLVPSAITSRYNRLILGNIKELYFDVNTTTYDTRAYRFRANKTTTVIYDADNLFPDVIKRDPTTLKIVDNDTDLDIALEHDCKNPFFSNTYDPMIMYSGSYNYQYNSSLIGATGSNISVEVTQTALSNPRNVLKSNEIYRLGIEFWNKYGQTTPPKWICDIKAPKSNLNGSYNTLKVTLANTQDLIDAGVVGWRVLRVDRTDQDKTILCQGIVSTMIFQKYDDLAIANSVNGVAYADLSLLKIPSPFIRNNTNLSELWLSPNAGTHYPFIYRNQHGICISEESSSGTIDDPRQEVYRVHSSGTERHLTFEETRLMQMYSPEVIFSSPSMSENLTLNISHVATNIIQDSAIWAKQYNTDTSFTENELKRTSMLSLFNQSSGKFNAFNQYARIGGTGEHNIKNEYQYYRKYKFNRFVNNPTSYNFLGSPILLDAGQSSLTYNDNNKYNFTNLLGTILTDKNDKSSNKDTGDDGIISVNSIANKNISFVLSSENKIETLSDGQSLANNSNYIFEIGRVLTNQYGGNSYESRSRNTYMRIGNYVPIATNVTNISEAGDTFVGQFRFARILSNPTKVQSSKYYEMTEIVEFPVETSIDINNRSDSSQSWDSKFMPTFDEYHNYNKVYSQQPIFNATISTPFTFVERRTFENRILASKTKIANQVVDNWTDVLLNEEIYVDGNYGAIVKLIKNNDLVACFQDNAVSALMIEPRVQTVGTDGTSIELGRGKVLYDYKYITTTSGGTNKQCIFKSPSSIYYMDVVNRTINRISSEGLQGLSDSNGLHSFMYNNTSSLYTGSNDIVGCFDQITNDAYFTTDTFTISFNEQTDNFISRYDFKPDRYISTYKGLYSAKLSPSLNAPAIWSHNTGEYGDYYEVKYDSFINLLVAPDPNADCVMNNVEFKSEVYDDGVDLPTITMDKIRAWNNYQDSGTIALTVGGNIRRKYRDWNMFMPRVANKPMQRIRNPWNFLQLDFNNDNNRKLVLHDVIVSYDSIIKQY